MEIFTIASVLIAEVVLIAKTLICFTLLRNCKITEDVEIIKPNERICSCQLKDSENSSEQKSHSTSPDITLRESVDEQTVITLKTRLAPVKPPRAFRQSRVRQDSEKNENDVHSKTLCSNNRYPSCYCGEHLKSSQKENGLQKLNIPTERNSSGFLPISNKLQKQISFRMDTNSSKSTCEASELAKLSRPELQMSSSQSRNSQFNCRSVNIPRKTGNNETTSTQYMELSTLDCPTRYLQQKMKRNKSGPLTSTEIGSKCANIKNSQFNKLCKYFARVFHRCFNQISKK